MKKFFLKTPHTLWEWGCPQRVMSLPNVVNVAFFPFTKKNKYIYKSIAMYLKKIVNKVYWNVWKPKKIGSSSKHLASVGLFYNLSEHLTAVNWIPVPLFIFCSLIPAFTLVQDGCEHTQKKKVWLMLMIMLRVVCHLLIIQMK